MDEARRLLHHYRLNAVEVWVGYGVATVVLLLWPGAQAAAWPAVVFGYFGLLAAVSLCALALIERRRPWPFGPRYEPIRRRSIAYVASVIIIVLLGMILPKLLEPAGIVMAIAVPIGLALLWVTLSFFWAPLRIRMYPHLHAAQGG
jgi:hypothetical protein